GKLVTASTDTSPRRPWGRCTMPTRSTGRDLLVADPDGHALSARDRGGAGERAQGADRSPLAADQAAAVGLRHRDGVDRGLALPALDDAGLVGMVREAADDGLDEPAHASISGLGGSGRGLREDRAHGRGNQGPAADPELGPVAVDLDLADARHRVVGAELLENLGARRPARVGDDDPVVGAVAGAHSPQAYLDHFRDVLSSNRKPRILHQVSFNPSAPGKAAWTDPSPARPCGRISSASSSGGTA